MSRVVRILTGCSGVEIPVTVRDFSQLNNVLAGTEAHPIQWELGFFLRGKATKA
jgi:hypothetical protein